MKTPKFFKLKGFSKDYKALVKNTRIQHRIQGFSKAYKDLRRIQGFSKEYKDRVKNIMRWYQSGVRKLIFI